MAEEERKNIEEIIEDSWSDALRIWSNPSIPHVIAVEEGERFEELGNIGAALRSELAFMKYPQFQTYANLKNIKEKLGDLESGVKAVLEHEAGHRFCPYDAITSLVLAHRAEKTLKDTAVNYDTKSAAKTTLNLFTDTCINTHLVRTGNNDIVWAFQELSKNNSSQFWRVYMSSLERCWNQKILPDNVALSEEENDAAELLAKLFKRNVLEMSWWERGIEQYASIIAPFLKEEDAQGICASASGNIPTEINPEQIARHLAKQGSNGLPTNKEAVKEFTELMAGYGISDPIQASIIFYENLAKRYRIRFAARPFGKPRQSPFSLEVWEPSDPIQELDIQQTIQSSGAVIPGITTKKWNSRTTNIKGGEKEVIPTLDIYLDSSGSMPNPTETVSLPVLACFVASQRAQRNGIQAINYDSRIVAASDRTNDLRKIYEVLVSYGKGGTVFPAAQFLANPEQDPRLALIVTDTFLTNTTAATEAITRFRRRNTNNRVSIYAITEIPKAEELVKAGAECIQGTTTNIFNHILGKTERTYTTK